MAQAMKVLFIGKSHEFSLRPFEAIRARHQIVGIVESGARGRLGTVDRLKIKARNIASMRDSHTLRGWAIRNSVPYFWMDHASRSRLEQFMLRCAPEIAAVASLPFLLPERILRIPQHGVINLHPSLLPKYHGPFPWLWQYLDDQSEIGVTVHRLDAGQDTGPIVKQRSLPLPRGTALSAAQAMVAFEGARLMSAAIDEFGNGSVRLTPQEFGDYPKARAVRRDEPLIDWANWPIERVWHALRGVYPWLDPLSCPPHLRNGRYRVETYEAGPPSGTPGHVYQDDGGFYVAHSQGKVRIR